ncbi:glycosyltransferase [Paenibacillus sp. PDC88]|uniref:glycosyltransferase n=1 Tax=Paenibacillus sp. PDC88 TaxID=1884375 RepID=UPI0008997D09|nr:glycosyltransferase [Paenibacillus sp. PDC88]SDW89017.1 Tetratricopeptide repeat-containing protein [Paenibacillus sp. PDC88]
MNNRSPISLCMIVRDEALFLEQCLASVSSVVSEMIIVDTGSTDRSVDIARAYGATVVHMEWQSDFAAARNESLRHAAQPWVLIMDADEQWVEGQQSRLFSLLLEASDGVYGFEVEIKSLLGRSGEDSVTDSACRIFRNDTRIRFKGRIHEEAATSILALGASTLRASGLQLLHYGYLDHIVKRKNKSERNFQLIKEALMQEPDSRILLYALGTEYFQLGDYDAAVRILEPLLDKLPTEAGYASDVFLKTIFALREKGELHQAVEKVEEGVSRYPGFADLQELKAVLLMDLGRDDEALGVLTNISRSREYTSVSGAGTYRSSYLTGVVYERKGEGRHACEAYEKAVEANPDYVPAWQRWIPLAVCSGELAQVERWIGKRGLTEKAQQVVLQQMLDMQQSVWVLKQKCWLQEAFSKMPWAEAILLAQLGERRVAARLLEPWHTHQDMAAEIGIYLQALCSDAAGRGQLRSGDPDRSVAMEDARWMGKQAEAFIRLGAWAGFGAWLPEVKEPSAVLVQLSPSARIGLLLAPLSVRRQLYSWLQEQKEVDREMRERTAASEQAYLNRTSEHEPDTARLEVDSSDRAVPTVQLFMRLALRASFKEKEAGLDLPSYEQEAARILKYKPASSIEAAQSGWNALELFMKQNPQRAEDRFQAAAQLMLL